MHWGQFVLDTLPKSQGGILTCTGGSSSWISHPSDKEALSHTLGAVCLRHPTKVTGRYFDMHWGWFISETPPK